MAGTFTPFSLSFSRRDGEQQIKDLSVSTPPGVLAKVKDVPLCPDAQAAAGTCAGATRIGTATVGSGAGSNPFYIQDQPVYLTGPYKNAPYGLAVVVRALAGPFDLGSVVVRQAVNIDPHDASITVTSDPLPTILDGIPLRIREVRVSIDRPGFMTTPTSCAAKTVNATFTSTDGATSQASVPYRVAGCSGFPFAPKIAIGLTNRSQTKSGKHPGIAFTLTQRPGKSNIKSVIVKLPPAVVLDANNASRALCEPGDADRDSCPDASIVGRALVKSPLLNRSLSGNVYFVKGVGTLPSLLVTLRGEISIDLRSTSRVDKNGQLVSRFTNVPDAPISQFRLRIRSGSQGILSVVNNGDLCAGKQLANIATSSQNGVSHHLVLKLKTPCGQPSRH